jgi:hypothetical protein
VSVAGRLASLTPEQRALFEAMRRRQPAAAPAAAPPPVRPVSGPRGLGDWPLSFDQERLFRMHQDHPGLVSWNVDAASRVTGALDLPAFAAAARRLADRHAAWRTVFPLVEGRPVQRVVASLPPRMALIDLSALPAARRYPERSEGGEEGAGGEAERALYDHTRQPFALERGPLVRLALVRLAPREHLFLLTIHHLVTDWITFQVFFRELLAIYQGSRGGTSAGAAGAADAAAAADLLPPLPAQFPDYVIWEREWWQGDTLAAELAHWQRQLAGYPLVLDLPGDRPRPPVQSQRGGLHRVHAGAARTAGLRALARREGATMFMAALAALYALLWRLTGRERLIVGSNSANRARAEMHPVVGFFLTQVPFACDLGGDPTFRELLARTRATALAAYSHQNLPFSRLIEAVGGGAADGSRNPVVQVLLLILEVQGAARTADLAFEPFALYDGNSRWDLMFGLYDDHDAGLVGSLEYNTDIFEASTVGGWLDLLYRIIDVVVADPETPLAALPALQAPAVLQAAPGAPALMPAAPGAASEVLAAPGPPAGAEVQR